MATGWQTISKSKYYFESDGTPASGFRKLNGIQMCFSSDGKMLTGWQKVDGKEYYFNKSTGEMAVNIIVDNKVLGPDGAVTTKFKTISKSNLDEYIEILLNTYGRDLDSVFDFVNAKKNFKYKMNKKLGDINEYCDDYCVRFLNTRVGACWDYAALTCKMVRALGYNAIFIVGKGHHYSEHNWVLIEVEKGVWRHMDTQKRMIRVCLVTDAQLEEWDKRSDLTYQWDHSKYPAAV